MEERIVKNNIYYKKYILNQHLNSMYEAYSSSKLINAFKEKNNSYMFDKIEKNLNKALKITSNKKIKNKIKFSEISKKELNIL